MFSTFSNIEIGKKGLMANRAGLDTIGHNLSNVETEGYSRQKVNLETFHPIFDPSANRAETPGQFGQGVVVEDIQRVRDTAIDDRVNFENSEVGYWSSKQQFLHQVEMVLNEPGKPNVRTVLDQYWESWQKVAADPADRASRQELIERAQTLTQTLNHTYQSLADLQQNADMLVEQRLSQVNQMSSEVAGLNVQIVKSEALGDQPNDLYDKRDLLIDKLSKIIPVKVERNNKHEVILYIGSENLVQGGHVNLLQGKGDPAKKGFLDIYWKEDGRKVNLGKGGLSGLISVRDDDIRTAIRHMDSLTVNLVDATNEVHRDGFGLNKTTDQNFFKKLNLTPYANGDMDFNHDGVVDGTALFRVSGTEVLTENTVIGSGGFLNLGPAVPGGQDVRIAYHASDKIKDVIDKINQSDAGVVATLNHKGNFSIKAKSSEDARFPEFAIRHLEDTGNLLTGITGILVNNGTQGAFDYKNTGDIAKLAVPEFQVTLSPEEHPAGWVALADAVLANPDNIAASGAQDTTGNGNPDTMNGLSDNRNALAIAGLKHQKIMVEGQTTYNEFFKSVIGDIGTRSETAKINFDKNRAVVESLVNLRKQVSGVNVDEELSKMIMFQHGYNASARLVSTFDRMLDTLMRMGA